MWWWPQAWVALKGDWTGMEDKSLSDNESQWLCANSRSSSKLPTNVRHKETMAGETEDASCFCLWTMVGNAVQDGPVTWSSSTFHHWFLCHPPPVLPIIHSPSLTFLTSLPSCSYSVSLALDYSIDTIRYPSAILPSYLRLTSPVPILSTAVSFRAIKDHFLPQCLLPPYFLQSFQFLSCVLDFSSPGFASNQIPSQSRAHAFHMRADKVLLICLHFPITFAAPPHNLPSCTK